jgi:hypothetical protein
VGRPRTGRDRDTPPGAHRDPVDRALGDHDDDPARVVGGDSDRRELLAEADHAQAAAYPPAQVAGVAGTGRRPVQVEAGEGIRVADGPGPST